ncbi:porin [Thauera sinica]|uniref:Porin n=1 Tax=Thauera sinica TaxID=2665146 RepID=A0ABW1ALT3_9RHOO|nr:porin [Thauera sp. K11]
MKKTLLTCAIAAGLSGAVHAQSNVTVYGIVDLGYSFRDADGQSNRNAIDSGISSGSRLGFRGTEDLGNGLNVKFVLEQGIKPDTGESDQSGRTFGRASWVSLAGAFGEVRAGRQNALGYDWFAGGVTPWGTNYLQANPKTIFGYDNVAERVDNAVFYYSPSFSGFQGAIGYARNGNGNETAGNENDTAVVSAALRYRNGPLLAVLTYDQKDVADSNTTVNRDDTRNIAIGATYDFGALKAHFGYGQLKNRGFKKDADNENAWLVGLTVPVSTAGKLMATYQRVNDARNMNEYGRKFDDNRSGFAVVYDHGLSKRTSLYAYASQYANVVLDKSGSSDKLGDATELALGVRHSF